MLHALTYSLIRHIDNQVPELSEVIWMYDGISLTDKVKPFSTVEQMNEANSNITAGRTDYEETFRFQVGLFTRSVSERSKLSETMKSVLRQKNITFYDTRGATPIQSGFFICDLTAITPIPVENAADNTNKHRVYFDIEVTVYRVNSNGLNFTQ